MSAALRFMAAPVSAVAGITVRGPTTELDWFIGKFQKLRLGDAVVSEPIIAGGERWVLEFYPKGFVDQEHASMYLRSLTASREDADESFKCFVSLKVFISPVKEEAIPSASSSVPASETASSAGSTASIQAGSIAGSAADGASRISGTRSVRSSASRSVKSSSSRRSSVTASSKKNKRAMGAGGMLSATDKEAIKVKEWDTDIPWKTMSTTYVPLKPSWGFTQFFDMSVLYNNKSGMMTMVPEGRSLQDGIIKLHIEITAVPEVDHQIENSEDIDETGRKRTEWVIRNFQVLRSKLAPGKKLSSSMFESDDYWYLDMFPNGYAISPHEKAASAKQLGYLSLFLHSDKSQVDHHKVLLQIFSLGIKVQNKVPPSESYLVTNGLAQQPMKPGDVYTVSKFKEIFNPDQRSVGKRKFLELGALDSPEFVSGDFSTGGDIVLVLDMLVTEEKSIGVHQNLFTPKAFMSVCSKTEKSLMFQSAQHNCAFCGQICSIDALNFKARLPQFGYEYNKDEIIRGIIKPKSVLEKIGFKPPSILANLGSGKTNGAQASKAHSISQNDDSDAGSVRSHKSNTSVHSNVSKMSGATHASRVSKVSATPSHHSAKSRHSRNSRTSRAGSINEADEEFDVPDRYQPPKDHDWYDDSFQLKYEEMMELKKAKFGKLDNSDQLQFEDDDGITPDERKELEDMEFEKPVCAGCFELINYLNLQRQDQWEYYKKQHGLGGEELDDDDEPKPPLRPRKDFRTRPLRVVRQWVKEGFEIESDNSGNQRIKQVPGGSKVLVNASTLARGANLYEPFETAERCPMRDEEGEPCAVNWKETPLELMIHCDACSRVVCKNHIANMAGSIAELKTIGKLCVECDAQRSTWPVLAEKEPSKEKNEEEGEEGKGGKPKSKGDEDEKKEGEAAAEEEDDEEKPWYKKLWPFGSKEED